MGEFPTGEVAKFARGGERFSFGLGTTPAGLEGAGVAWAQPIHEER